MKEKRYQAFSNKIDFSEFDHIIIGSGIGGLTTAVWLAKAGKKVAVLEKHYVPGGFTHSFKRKNGYQWDVGVHYIGNLGEDGILKKLFNHLSDSQLEWESMGKVYDKVFMGGDEYDFVAGKENFRKKIKEYFPDDQEAIDQYLKLIDKSNRLGRAFFFEKTFEPLLSKSLGWLIRQAFKKYSQKTTHQVLSTITKNKKLISVLCAQCGNYGLSPKKSSFAAHAMVISHFLEGGYYPKGGAPEISLKSIETLNAFGGKVFINAEVKKIITKKNRVKAIVVRDTTIPCKSVISNIGVANTFKKLLTKKESDYCNFNLKKVKASTSHLCLYIGLDKSDQELNLPKNNIWFHHSYDIDKNLEAFPFETLPSRFAYLSFPSAKDKRWQKKYPHKATIQALAVGNYDWFSKYENLPWMKRGKEYEAIKKEFENNMLKKVYQLLPEIKGHVVVTEVSTPLSTKYFSNYQEGEIYGLEHSPTRFKLPFLRFTTKIKGLRLVGQDITLVGVGGAIISGMLCATTILKFKSWTAFKNLNKTNNELLLEQKKRLN